MEMGYQPIPVLGKASVLEGWSAFSSQKMDEIAIHQIEGRFSRIAELGVAFVCGNDYFAIDIDSDDERLRALMPDTPMKKRGATGFTFFYRGPAVQSRRSRLFPVELLSNGTYTVVPPSPHPKDDCRYSWIEGTSAVPVEELTEISDPSELFTMIEEYCRDNAIMRPVKQVAAGGDTVSEGDDVKSPGLGVGGRNNHLTAVAYALACHMRLKNKSEDDIAAELLAEDERAHGANAWLADPKEHRNKLTPLQRAKKMIAAAVKKATAQGDLLAEYKIEIGSNADLKITDSIVEDEVVVHSVERVPGLIEIASPAEYQALIDQVPLLKLYAAYIKQRAPKHYSPALTLGSGLVLLGACASNLYEMNEATPNLLVLNCAVTGFGKDIVQKGLKRILNEVKRAGGPNYIGFSRYSSSAAIYKNLAQNNRRVRVDVQDEASYLLGKINDKRGPLNGAVEALSELWSATHDVLDENAVMDKERRISAVANPCLLWLGSTTPIGMKEILDNELLSKGLGSRILYFIENRTLLDMKEPFKLKKRIVEYVSPELFDPIYQYLVRDPQLLDSRVNVSESPAMKLVRVEEPAADRDAIERWLAVCQQSVLKHCAERAARMGGDANQEDRVAIMLSRRVEMILRLLSTWFVGHRGERAIGEEALVWANQICAFSLGNVEAYAQRAGEALVDKVQRVVRAKLKGKTAKRARVMDEIRKALQPFGRSDMDIKIEAELRRNGYIQDAGQNLHRQPIVKIL